MASHGHLDAFAGREVVFCHACNIQWYRNEQGLICPGCGSGATEIITRDSDPRSFNYAQPGPDPEESHHSYNDPSPAPDPGEADIDRVVFGYPGPRGDFFGQRTTFRDPEGSNPGNASRANPRDVDDIMRQFSANLSAIAGNGITGRSGPETLYGSSRGGPARATYSSFSGPGFTGGVSTISITTGRGVPRGGPVGGNGDHFQDVFQTSFSDILRGIAPPLPATGRAPMPSEPGPRLAPIMTGPPGNGMHAMVGQILALLDSGAAIHGDAVYSQEALDRIISNMMEANPQSNAPPPASAEAIASLPRRKLDKSMLDPEQDKGECTICIDEMELGDEAIVLPCKHWFHEECAALWLNEHNTCPICRAPIEGDAVGQAAAASPSSPAQPFGSPAASSSRSPPPSDRQERLRSNMLQRGEARLEFIRGAGRPEERRYSPRASPDQPPSPRELAPLNPSVLRSPSPSSRQSDQSDRSNGAGGPLNWLRDRFSSTDRRRS